MPSSLKMCSACFLTSGSILAYKLAVFAMIHLRLEWKCASITILYTNVRANAIQIYAFWSGVGLIFHPPRVER